MSDNTNSPRTIASLLSSQASLCPDRPYIKCGGDWLTLGDLDGIADRLAQGLADLGVTKGDRVAVLLSNCQELIEVFFACAKLGAILVPVNCFLKGEFLRHQLADAEPRVLVSDDIGHRAALDADPDSTVQRRVLVGDGDLGESVTATPYRELMVKGLEPSALPQIHAHDPLAILYTSGTTGRSKGCIISNGYYFGNAKANRDADWVIPDDRILTAFPLFHMGGQHVMVSALANEASVCVQTAFSASTFMADAIAEGVTSLFGVGPMAMALLAQPETETPDPARRFRMAMFTPLSESAQRAFRDRFGTPLVAGGYGQTECSPITSSDLRGVRKPGTVGRPVDHLEVAIVDGTDCPVAPGQVGEIVVRPRIPNMVFSGYWNNPDATVKASANLWHHTGDYGTLDSDGFLTYVDRKTDSLRRRGENLSSFELESAIMKHPGVAQVAITAVESPLGEDDIKATVVWQAGASATPAEMFEFFRDVLPYFAIPRYLEAREALPAGPLGRVMKHVLRAEGVGERTWDLEEMGFRVETDARRGTRA